MLIAFTLGFFLSVIVIYVSMPLAISVRLVDAPCVRKQHIGEVPLVGGLAIYITLATLWLILPFWGEQNSGWLIGLGLPLLLVGLVDDRWEISAAKRFLVEILCCTYAAVYCDIRIYDIGSLWPGVGGTLVFLSIPLTIIGMVGVINAVNMTDGVDGLAGGLVSLTFLALTTLTLQTNVNVALQLVSIVSAIAGFLVFNSRFFGRGRAAIFLGDSGAIFIGFAVAWYLIMLSQGPAAVITPVSALWLVAVPLVDTGTVMIRRICRGQSPFSADREHFHHILLLAGFGTNRTVLIILFAQFCYILFGMATIHFNVPDWISFWLFMGVFVCYYWCMNSAWKVMKQLKSFREWAGFENRRNEKNGSSGRRSNLDRRQKERRFFGPDRRSGTDQRSNSDRRLEGNLVRAEPSEGCPVAERTTDL